MYLIFMIQAKSLCGSRALFELAHWIFHDPNKKIHDPFRSYDLQFRSYYSRETGSIVDVSKNKTYPEPFPSYTLVI